MTQVTKQQKRVSAAKTARNRASRGAGTESHVASPAPMATPRQAARRRAEVDRALDPEFFKALADGTRVKLLSCLLRCCRPCSVSEIAECCSVDFSVVARHLMVLARAGIVSSQKSGRIVWYSVNNDSLCDRLRSLVEAIEQWQPCADSRESCNPSCESGSDGCGGC